MPTVYLLSNFYPNPGTAGSVIRYRHMNYERSLSVDFRVLYREDNAEIALPEDLNIKCGLFTRIFRRAFYLLRSDISFSWMDKLIALLESIRLNDRIKLSSEDWLIMVLERKDDLLLADQLVKSGGFKFGIFLHDASEFFLKNNNAFSKEAAYELNQRLLEKSDVIWSVSKSLATHYDSKFMDKTVILPPVSGVRLNVPDTPWSEELCSSPVIGYAGRIRADQKEKLMILAERLAHVDGKLFVAGQDMNGVMPELTKIHNNIVWAGFQNTPEEALLAIRASCCAFVSISPDSEDSKWAQFSFPSKIVEFCGLGIPVGIFAPEEYAVSSWARDRNWNLLYPSVCSETVDHFIEALRKEEDWTAASQQARSARENEFNPAVILETFHQSIVNHSLKPPDTAQRQ